MLNIEVVDGTIETPSLLAIKPAKVTKETTSTSPNSTAIFTPETERERSLTPRDSDISRQFEQARKRMVVDHAGDSQKDVPFISSTPLLGITDER